MNDYIADSFYHFTCKKEYLFSIIKNGFYPRYCIEDYSYLLKKYSTGKIAIPMVCFCDIPILFIEEHVENYGEFAIAMKKEWGEKYLNPLLYLTEESIPQKMIEYIQWDLMNEINKNINDKINEKKAIEMFYIFHDFIAYMKKYKGPSSKHDKKEIIFYREREWRWIPKVNEEDFKREIMLRLEPSDFPNIYKENNLLEKKYKLEFSTDDVDYLIVNNAEVKKELEHLLYEIDKIKLINKIHILKELVEKTKNEIVSKS
jgi:hypothetical protein